MRPPRSPAARRVLALWNDAARHDRFRAAAQWRTTPMAALEQEVPLAGDILEVGCRTGVFATYLAVTSRARRVTGVDGDAEMVARAGRAAAHLGRGEADVSFQRARPGEVARHDGGWRCVVITDGLHAVARDRRGTLLADCVGSLAPGGLLVVKGFARVASLKVQLARLQSRLGTRALGTEAGHTPDLPPVRELREELDRLGLVTMAKRIDHDHLLPHVVVLGAKPTEPLGG